MRQNTKPELAHFNMQNRHHIQLVGQTRQIILLKSAVVLARIFGVCVQIQWGSISCI